MQKKDWRKKKLNKMRKELNKRTNLMQSRKEMRRHPRKQKENIERPDQAPVQQRENNWRRCHTAMAQELLGC